MLKKSIFMVLFVGAIAVGGYFVYNSAYSSGVSAGNAAGYTSGYSDGGADGTSSGYVRGKDEGLSAGKTEGYDAGYGDGVVAAIGHGYTLRDPTYAEVLKFLSEDTTNKNPYVEPTYVCTHFARDVINNAVSKGIRAAFVEIRHPGMGHAIVAFETIDKGLLYFEPQFDDEVRPAIGTKLHQCVIPKKGVIMVAPTYDDTINDILVIW